MKGVGEECYVSPIVTVKNRRPLSTTGSEFVRSAVCAEEVHSGCVVYLFVLNKCAVQGGQKSSCSRVASEPS